MKYILLVEDDLSLISGLSFAVKKAGYGLDIAHTKSEADEIWEDGKYDLVILDVSLPDGSGFDICKSIREISKVRRCAWQPLSVKISKTVLLL